MMPAVRSVFRFGNVEINVLNLQLTVDGEVRPVEPKAFRVLQFLLENPGRAVTKEELMTAVWADVAVTDNALTRAIAQLRKALDDDARNPRFIETVPTVGYRFVAQPDAPPVAPAAKRRFPFLAAALLLAIAVAAVAYLRFPRAASSPALAAQAQLTSGSGLDINATFSPDGHLLAYASDRSGAFEIYIRPSNGDGQETQLTADNGQNLFPSFSPDGQAIVYSSSRNPGIYRISTHGGATQRLTTFGAQPAWSPDGKWVAFLSHQKPSLATTDYYFPGPDTTLFLVPANGGTPREITPAARITGKQVFPSWSADGKELRFVNYTSQIPSLWTYRPEGDQLERRFEIPGGLTMGSATISRDNRHLYFISSRINGDIGIWHVPLDAASLKPLAEPTLIYHPNLGSPRDLALSPDGRRLLYSAVLNHSQIQLQTLQSGLPSGVPTDIGRGTGYRFNMPQWSPDGRALLYTKIPVGRPAQTWLDRLDGTPAVTLGLPSESQHFPQFIAGGSAVRATVYSPTEKGVRIQDIPLTGGTLTNRPIPERLLQPCYSPDGRWVVYHSNVPIPQVWKMEVETGKRTQLTFGNEFHGYALFSPDSRWLEVQTETPGGGTKIWVMPADGGKLEPVIEQAGTWWTGGWSGDGKSLLVAGTQGNGWAIYAVSREARKLERLTPDLPLRQYIRYPRWSPDGSRIAYEFNESKGNVFVAEISGK